MAHSAQFSFRGMNMTALGGDRDWVAHASKHA
jgi:hypothetical protein